MSGSSEKQQSLSYNTFPSGDPLANTHDTRSNSRSPLLVHSAHHHSDLISSFRILPLRSKLFFFAMVAIPSFLLASTTISSLGSLNPLRSTTRSPYPEAIPAPVADAVATTLHNGDFRSVLGPVVAENFPDPAIIHHNGISYAFATNNKGVGKYGMIHIQVATSTNNQTWTVMAGHDALPSAGAWETGFGIWAPDVVQVANGSFVMYYSSSTVWAPEHHCLGAATSDSITGPYKPLDKPWACPDVYSKGGAIDPDGFLDPSTNKRYVTYKVDGNSIGHGGLCMNSVAPIVSTPIMLQEVGQDGLTLIGEAREILDRDVLDGPLVEAPSLHLSHEGIYFLFYSSNCFTTPLYATSYATAAKIWGPYKKQGRPLLVTGDGPNLVGPGGLDIIKGGDLVLFHGHLNDKNIEGDMDEVLAAKAGRRSKRKLINRSLIRGMYTAVPQFNGTRVDLSGPIPGSVQ